MLNIFWMRRDLRLHDNAALFHALSSGRKVLLLFIFDNNIIEKLGKDDTRVNFIHTKLSEIQRALIQCNSSLIVKKGDPEQVFRELIKEYPLHSVYFNQDFEPYAIRRDEAVKKILSDAGIGFMPFTDHVIMHPDEVLKDDHQPYTVFTPYSKRWKFRLDESKLNSFPSEKYLSSLEPLNADIPTLEELGFIHRQFAYPEPIISPEILRNYSENRNIPHLEKGTSRLGIHLRFGTVSIRQCMTLAARYSETWMNELIWREFFIQIMWHFPEVVNLEFRPSYRGIEWLDPEENFNKWAEGMTGYPLVDAGMRELNKTGFMHNRVRMITASFLTKHLMIDWRKGEQYFASKLLDYELASNNGNWQWVAGTGCDAAPYFRIFNPVSQQKKFDPEFRYVSRWVPEFNTPQYPAPIVEHEFARNRWLSAFRSRV